MQWVIARMIQRLHRQSLQRRLLLIRTLLHADGIAERALGLLEHAWRLLSTLTKRTWMVHTHTVHPHTVGMQSFTLNQHTNLLLGLLELSLTTDSGNRIKKSTTITSILVIVLWSESLGTALSEHSPDFLTRGNRSN